MQAMQTTRQGIQPLPHGNGRPARFRTSRRRRRSRLAARPSVPQTCAPNENRQENIASDCKLMVSVRRFELLTSSVSARGGRPPFSFQRLDIDADEGVQARTEPILKQNTSPLFQPRRQRRTPIDKGPQDGKDFRPPKTRCRSQLRHAKGLSDELAVNSLLVLREKQFLARQGKRHANRVLVNLRLWLSLENLNPILEHRDS